MTHFFFFFFGSVGTECPAASDAGTSDFTELTGDFCSVPLLDSWIVLSGCLLWSDLNIGGGLSSSLVGVGGLVLAALPLSKDLSLDLNV
jgi:hypothetical protein